LFAVVFGVLGGAARPSCGVLVSSILRACLADENAAKVAGRIVNEKFGCAPTSLDGCCGISVDAADAGFSLALLNAIAAAGVQIRDFQVRKPTLDDVFVRLVQNDNAQVNDCAEAGN
jgi:hypothetical protein